MAIATWSGVPIAEILELASPLPEATNISLVSTEGFKVNVDPEIEIKPENYLAYEWEGQPIPVPHGFPLHSAFPGKEGSYWVKWLVEINVS